MSGSLIAWQATLTCVALIIVAACALTCDDECDRSTCVQHGECAYGEVRDQCLCCPVCGKGPGDICGGTFNAYGRCGTGLVCHVQAPYPASLQIPGTCIPVVGTYRLHDGRAESVAGFSYRKLYMETNVV